MLGQRSLPCRMRRNTGKLATGEITGSVRRNVTKPFAI
jgi:hypothetical protein